MKFSYSVEINAPIKEVALLFDDFNNRLLWQDGFKSKEHLNGLAGLPGSKSKLVFSYGKRTMELIETVQINHLPEEYTALYEHEHMVNTMTTNFEAIGDAKTKYTVIIHYTKFIGFMPRLMAKIAPGLFKKQAQKWSDQFKTFVENSYIHRKPWTV